MSFDFFLVKYLNIPKLIIEIIEISLGAAV